MPAPSLPPTPPPLGNPVSDDVDWSLGMGAVFRCPDDPGHQPGKGMGSYKRIVCFSIVIGECHNNKWQKPTPMIHSLP